MTKYTIVLNFGNQKLSMGGTAEKIISALHNVLSEHSKEESDLNKCKAAVMHAAKLEKDVESVCKHGK